MGRLLGNLRTSPATKLGGVAIKAALERAGVTPDQVQYVIMGQVLQAGAGQIPARQAAVKAGIPMTVAGDHDQQGVPVRPGRDRAGRPAHPGRRVRHRRRRRHGVDDQRAAPAADSRHGLQVRRRRDARPHGARRPDRRVRPLPMGESTERHNAELGIGRAEQDEFGARRHQRAAAAQKNGAVRRGDRAGAGPAAQGRPDRDQRGRGHPRRTPRPSRWPSCGRRSARTARSPPARPRRSPTAPARSSS